MVQCMNNMTTCNIFLIKHHKWSSSFYDILLSMFFGGLFFRDSRRE